MRCGVSARFFGAVVLRIQLILLCVFSHARKPAGIMIRRNSDEQRAALLFEIELSLAERIANNTAIKNKSIIPSSAAAGPKDGRGRVI